MAGPGSQAESVQNHRKELGFAMTVMQQVVGQYRALCAASVGAVEVINNIGWTTDADL